MISHDQHDRIVSQLYAAAAGEIAWRAVLAQTADNFGHSAAVLVVLDTAEGVLRAETHGKPPDAALEYYHSDVYRNDPRTPVHLAVQPGQLYHDRALYDVSVLLRDPRVRETIETIDVAHQIGISLRLPHGAPGMFTLLSTEAEGMPTDSDVAAFTRLAPHIEQACALAEILERTASTQAMLLEALEARADGVILLDAAGQLAFVNEGARRILALADGLAWSPAGFATARSAETRRLRAIVLGAIAGPRSDARSMPGGQMLVTRPSMRKPYVVRVLPAPPVERLLSRFGFACVIHIHDLGASRTPDRDLLSAFGLTDRETDLAVELVRCAGLAAAATSAGMAHNTARNHLQGLFRKCGVSTQAELIQQLSRLA